MDRICQNCKYRTKINTTDWKHTNRPETSSYCTLKAITVRDYNHCPKFQPVVSFVTLDVNYDANGTPVSE